MTPDNAWVYAILPFITVVLLTAGFVVAYRQRSAGRWAALAAHPQRRLAPRPWWSSPWLWLGVGVVSMVLAVCGWAWLFGFTFVAIPRAGIGRLRAEAVE